MAVDSVGPKAVSINAPVGLSLQTPAGLSLHRKRDPQEQDKKLHEVAELYEQQFLREMVKAMRQTVPEGGLTKTSQGEQIYKEQLDHNYVEQWSHGGGLGLQDIIYQQLHEKYGVAMGLNAAQVRPQGPLPLDSKSNLQNIFAVRSGASSSAINQKTLQMNFSKINNEFRQPVDLQAPWAGRVAKAYALGNLGEDQQVLEIEHDNGLFSQLAFRGQSQVKAGSTIDAAQPIALLSPEAQAFFWNVSRFSPTRPE